MSGHTPGPWKLSPWFESGWRGIAKEPTPNRWQCVHQPIPGRAHGSLSSIISVGVLGDVDDYWLSIREPNARLIAAAPDLLDALRNLYGIALDEGIVGDRTTLSAARAAIAKATGESA